MSLFTAALETFAKDFLANNAEVLEFKTDFEAIKTAIITLEARVEAMEKAVKTG